MREPLAPKPGFEWAKVRWTGPDALVDRRWQEGSATTVFCERCMREWFGLESIPAEDPTTIGGDEEDDVDAAFDEDPNGDDEDDDTDLDAD